MRPTDYWTAWGEEVVAALEAAGIEDGSPQDGFEAAARSGLVDAVERWGVERLTDVQRAALTAELATILERPVPADAVETAIERTALRCPQAGQK